MPASLKRGPFTLEHARRAGIGPSHLKGLSWSRIGPGTYLWKKLDDNPIHALQSALLRLPDSAAFSGLTAAWLHGIDVAPNDPIEVTIPNGVGISARAGMSVRRASLPKHEVTTLRGIRATSLVRTLAEVCGRLDLTEAVVIADMALHAGGVDVGQLRAWADSHARQRGIAQFRKVIEHAEPKAESPMETRLRMLLLLAGLPRPAAQVVIRDRWRRFVGRTDLYYEPHHLGIEYDGGTHRDSLAEDNRRQNRLLGAGIRLLRFTAGDVLNNPESVVAQVRAQLASSAGTGLSR